MLDVKGQLYHLWLKLTRVLSAEFSRLNIYYQLIKRNRSLTADGTTGPKAAMDMSITDYRLRTADVDGRSLYRRSPNSRFFRRDLT